MYHSTQPIPTHVGPLPNRGLFMFWVSAKARFLQRSFPGQSRPQVGPVPS